MVLFCEDPVFASRTMRGGVSGHSSHVAVAACTVKWDQRVAPAGRAPPRSDDLQ